MALSCGIIGLPMVGKTTFFNLLTNAGVETSAFFSGKTTTNNGHALIPDSRINYLAGIFKPKKTTYARVEVIDIPGLVRGASRGQGSGNEFLSAIRQTDALAHIVRAFENEDILHAEGSLDLLRDIETINMELLFADLQLIETRLEKINSGHKKKLEHPLEEDALKKCRAYLEDEKPLKQLDLSIDEEEALKHMTFLTKKPMLIVLNLDENQFASQDYPQKEQVEAYCAAENMVMLTVCARLEEEIEQLPEEEKSLFLADLGINESGVARMAQAFYRQLGLISFLTAGEDEVRAWTIVSGTPAKIAAGKIHSDIERGFIRAETVAFAHLEEAGSMAAAREKGFFRLEGKEYIVKDGDIINFRFNV